MSDKVVKVPWMRSNSCKLKIYQEDFGYNFEGELSGYAIVMFFFFYLEIWALNIVVMVCCVLPFSFWQRFAKLVLILLFGEIFNSHFGGFKTRISIFLTQAV